MRYLAVVNGRVVANELRAGTARDKAIALGNNPDNVIIKPQRESGEYRIGFLRAVRAEH